MPRTLIHILCAERKLVIDSISCFKKDVMTKNSRMILVQNLVYSLFSVKFCKWAKVPGKGKKFESKIASKFDERFPENNCRNFQIFSREFPLLNTLIVLIYEAEFVQKKNPYPFNLDYLLFLCPNSIELGKKEIDWLNEHVCISASKAILPKPKWSILARI